MVGLGIIKIFVASIKKKLFYWRMCRINSTPYVYDIKKHKLWGDNIIINKINANHSFEITGWLKRLPKEGDKLLYYTKSGKKVIGYITNIELCINPKDMFFAHVVPYEYIIS